MELAGEGYIVASIGEEGGEVPYTCFMAAKDYLEKNGDVAEAFIRAVYKGQRWVASAQAEEIAEAIKDSFPDNDMELLVTVVKRYKDIDVWMSDPVMKEDSYDRLISIIKEAGIIEEGPEFEKLVDNSIAQKLIDEQA
jgi:NMT1/THI5 domain protein